MATYPGIQIWAMEETLVGVSITRGRPITMEDMIGLEIPTQGLDGITPMDQGRAVTSIGATSLELGK